MKILYVSQYFPPEMGAPSARVHELSRLWVRRGHQVTVLTAFANHPTGEKARRDRGVLSRREVLDGIEVLRTYSYATPNRGVFRRMASYASFGISASTLGRLRLRRYDVVIATSPQLLCGLAGYTLARTLGSPFIFEVRDLWPESILAVGAMGENLVVRGLKRVAAHLYRHADRIVTVGEGYREKIHELYGIDPSRIDVISNGIDKDLFVPNGRGEGIRREYGWKDRFVVMYIGAHGMAHALHRVLEAARGLARESEILFVFVGEGAEKARLQRKSREWGLGNVQFIDPQPRSRTPQFYSACDLGLVTLKDSSLFRAVLPSKIFEYLGMERPILISVDGEAREIVEGCGAGRYVPPEDVPAMMDAIRQMSRSREELERMGRRGRRHVLENYDRDRLAGRYLEILRGGRRLALARN
ncbi:MAG: glycosyltransferase family 4 protein [Planctomycetota bacterium]|nr:glycosyltransferase family 4 protein [Planctomycetota bacterium]